MNEPPRVNRRPEQGGQRLGNLATFMLFYQNLEPPVKEEE